MPKWMKCMNRLALVAEPNYFRNDCFTIEPFNLDFSCSFNALHRTIMFEKETVVFEKRANTGLVNRFINWHRSGHIPLNLVCGNHLFSKVLELNIIRSTMKLKDKIGI